MCTLKCVRLCSWMLTWPRDPSTPLVYVTSEIICRPAIYIKFAITSLSQIEIIEAVGLGELMTRYPLINLGTLHLGENEIFIYIMFTLEQIAMPIVVDYIYCRVVQGFLCGRRPESFGYMSKTVYIDSTYIIESNMNATSLAFLSNIYIN